MLKVNERLLAAEITSVLEEEDGGVFLVSAPTGDTLEVLIEGGHAKVFRSLFLEDARRPDRLWTIVKIGELG